MQPGTLMWILIAVGAVLIVVGWLLDQLFDSGMDLEFLGLGCLLGAFVVGVQHG